MNGIFVRPARAEDNVNFVKWSLETKNNLFDPRIGLSPGTRTFCAYDKSGPIVFAPVQTPMFVEAIGLNPDVSKSKATLALDALLQFLVTQAHATGTAEIYFYSDEPSLQNIAEKSGFEEVPYKLYRLKVKDTEPSE